jgi:outer membrane protein OmpA-like peptidoglycan-associated protein/tetratricopeptide (TPR) repeat protein
MKKLLILFLCFSLCTGLSAQPYDPEKVNKKAKELYDQAMERAQDGNIASATGLLLKCVEIDPKFVDAFLSLAGAYSQLKNYTTSIRYYEQAFALDSSYTISYKLPYSVNLAGLGEFDKALAAINQLLAQKLSPTSATYKTAMARKNSYEFAVEYAKNNNIKNYVFAPQNLGPGINTSEPEYFPSLTIDGKELIFTRRVNHRNEDFFSSTKNGDNWSAGVSLPGNVNTPDNEAAQSISNDGQWLVFTAMGRQQSMGNFDIYFSFLTPQGWSEAVNAGFNVNSDQWDSQPCLSSDKEDLYFASRRLGGFGGIDIYVCHLQPSGRWGAAVNLGPSINTAGDDQCPFIHADNQTLYFTSNGLQGYGGNDLFLSRKGPDGAWGKPENLGYPINTINDEGTLFIAADGVTAYYASDRSDSRGSHDIYSFELRPEIRPIKTLWVRGQVTDKKTLQGLSSTVELTDLASKQVITKIQTDETGHYLVTLSLGKDYAFTINRKGYLFYSDNFLMSGLPHDTTYEKNIALQPIEANASVVLNNIFFDVNKSELKPASQAELDMLVLLLNENPTVKIEISGHTDNAGKPADNLVLSNNRAKAVVNYLVSKNIAPARLVAKGYGETKPVADNKTEQGKALNRRTEMKVISR